MKVYQLKLSTKIKEEIKIYLLFLRMVKAKQIVTKQALILKFLKEWL